MIEVSLICGAGRKLHLKPTVEPVALRMGVGAHPPAKSVRRFQHKDLSTRCPQSFGCGKPCETGSNYEYHTPSLAAFRESPERVRNLVEDFDARGRV